MKKIVSILMLSVISIAIGCNASALSYSDNIGLNFTFSPSLTVSLSSSDIVINDLTPGSSSDSNIITINVLSNNQNGYELKSTVGNNTTYDTRNLVHNNGSSNSATHAVFNSIDYDSSETSLTTDNTWGYAYSDQTVATPTWSNYSGLPKYDDADNIATLKTSNAPSSSTGDNIEFKIAAKAATTQASGEHNNVINFIVVGNTNPISLYDAYANANKTMYNGYYKIQDMSPSICSSVEVEESQLQVIDVRDNNIYTIAKLKDNRCWMTTNLNLEGGTEIESTLSDVPEGYTLPVANGFQEGNRLPESNAIGFRDAGIAYLYNSNNTVCSQEQPCFSYYSWTAATVGSGLNLSSSDIDAPYSICPKNWKLPTARLNISDKSELYQLAVAYGMNADASEEMSSIFYNNAGPSTIADFLTGGQYDSGGLSDGGHLGRYWSASQDKRSGTTAGNSFDLVFSTSRIAVWSSNNSILGFSVRCIANSE